MRLAYALAALVAVALAGAVVGARWRHARAVDATWEREQARFAEIRARLGVTEASAPRRLTYVTHWEAQGDAVRARVEACPSCHLGVEDPRMTGDAVPRELRVHPRRELYLGNHPPRTFGCTPCHGGYVEGDAAWETPHPRVVRAYAPSGPAWKLDAPAEEPLARLGAPIDAPISPASDARALLASVPEVQGSCLKCHSADVELEGAPLLARGRALFTDLGCAGCHATQRAPSGDARSAPAPVSPVPREPRVAEDEAGPPLDDLDARFTEAYVRAYLRDPDAFEPHGRMPRVWPAEGDARAIDDEIRDVTAFLYEQSAQRADAGRAPKIARGANVPGASAAEGAAIYAAYGCAACHDGHDARDARRARAPRLACAAEAFAARADWLAAYLADPQRAMPSARMPQMGLGAREAASVALYLVDTRDPRCAARVPLEGAGGGPPASDEEQRRAEHARRTERVPCAALGVDAPRAACGEILFAQRGCVACHALDGASGRRPARSRPDTASGGRPARSRPDTASGGRPARSRPDTASGGRPARSTADTASPAPPAPRLDGYAARARLSPDATLAILTGGRAPHDYALDTEEARALLVFLAGLGDATPRAELDAAEIPARREAADGAELARELQCAACHESADARIPRLASIGARARPEWLFEVLESPAARGVRPALHPEWVYGDLVPRDKLAPRMPRYELRASEQLALARLLAARGGAPFPYAPPPARTLEPRDKIAAAAALNQSCMRCHYSGALPRERAKTEDLAPDLARTRERLRPEWVRAFLSSHVPGRSAPPADPLPDFLFLLRDTTKLPRPGEESRAPILGLSD